MINNFIFWAQALDNSSPDHIRMEENDLTSEEADQRQKAVSLVSAVVKTGRCVFEKQNVRLFDDGKHFVIEITSAQCDQIDRTAPIVCYGEYDKNICETLGDGITNHLQQFTEAIGRSIGPDQTKQVNESIEQLKKNISKRKLHVIGKIAIVISLLLLSLLYHLLSKQNRLTGNGGEPNTRVSDTRQ